MGGASTSLLRAALLCLAAMPAFAAEVIDPAAARRAIAEPTVVATDASLSALAESGRTSDLALQVRRISIDRTLEPVAREWLLDRGLHALARQQPTAEARTVVQQLAGRPPEVFGRIDPDHGDHATPLYDTGATARFVLRAWRRSDARAAAEADLAAGRTQFVERFAVNPSGPQRQGIVEAIELAPLAQLSVQRNAAAAAMSAGMRVDEVALLLARRLADVELASLVIGHADARVALDALRLLPAVLDSQSAFRMLAEASRRADIASAAMLAIGPVARQDAIARSFLFERIDDPELGASAATALASIDDPAIAAEIGRRLSTTSSDIARRHFVLALQLDGGSAARDELGRFVASQQGSAQLRSEVRRWLDR
jgi:hypothetical protein